MQQNNLTKKTNITYIPGRPGIPGDPGQPYLPPRYALIGHRLYTWMVTAEYYFKSTSLDGSQGYPVEFVSVKDSSGKVIDLWVLMSRVEPVYGLVPAQPYRPPTPAVPPVPSQVRHDYNIGWNAGARSIVAASGPVRFVFKVPLTISGAVVGLASNDPDADIKLIQQSLYFSGVAVHAMQNGLVGPVVGANESGLIWAIERYADGGVSAFRGDIKVHDFDTLSSGPVFLDTSLYVGGDFIYDPAVVWSGSASLVLPKMQAIGSDADGYSTGEISLLKMMAQGWGIENIPPGVNPPIPPGGLGPDTHIGAGYVELPSMTASGHDTPYAVAQLNMPKMVVNSESGYPTPPFGVGGVWLPLMTVAACGISGGVGSAEIVLPKMQAIGADHDYAFSEISMPKMLVFSGGDDPGVAEMRVWAGSSGGLDAEGAEILTLLFRAQASCAMGMNSILDADIPVRARVVFALEVVGETLLQLLATAYGMSPLADPGAESFAWAATEQGGMVTRYSGYNFQSFAEINGKHYGVRADGLFLLEGTDDADVPISAELAFGGTDFGSAALKHLPNVYVGVKATDGRLFLKVETSQGEFTYEARRADERMATQRFDLGRGLRDNWFDFTLIAEDVTAFELDNIEFKPVTSKRRI